jgi:hypothetical protein
MQNLLRVSLAAFLALATVEPVYAAQQTIGVGASADDHTGDPLRTAFQKTNSNFNDLYGCSPLAAGTGISISGCIISATGGGGTPGGSNGQLQINNSGAFGGVAIGSGLTLSGGTLIDSTRRLG